jgi:heme/copper-type cytochrome/quinol oxidase subunit 2
MEYETISALLTITVILLSVVIITLLVIAISTLVKLRRIARNVNQITGNIAAASEWLVPSKLISEIVKLFNKNKKE